MQVGYWLRTATAFLQSKGITTARLDCLVLLEDTMRVRREKLLAEPTSEISDVQVAHLQKLLSRRAQHEPLAYIRGRTEFYGRNFVITPDVLEPRPESETMIDLLKEINVFGPAKTPQNSSEASPKQPASSEAVKDQNHTYSGQKEIKKLSIADIGTGSGALGITAALELPDSEVELIDIDTAALRIAKRNVDLYTISISTIKSDLLADTQKNYNVLLCNLPYVPDTFTINPAAMREPKIAIFGGPDGLDLYRKLFLQLRERRNNPLYILTEALPPQHEVLTAIADGYGYTLLKTDDFIQLFARKQPIS